MGRKQFDSRGTRDFLSRSLNRCASKEPWFAIQHFLIAELDMPQASNRITEKNSVGGLDINKFQNVLFCVQCRLQKVAAKYSV